MAVTGLQITSRELFAGGAKFGTAGTYERLDGTVTFSVDPDAPLNAGIVDLDRAERDPSGQVTFTADFCLLQPRDPACSNRKLLFDVVNRGNKTVLRHFNRSVAPEIPSAAIEPGDGFLLRHGWTLAWCGWQWDVIRSYGRLSLDAPVALQDGSPIEGMVICQFQPNETHADQLLAHWPYHPPPGTPHFGHKPYPAADVDDPHATMTVRDWMDGPRTVIPRERWQFARDQAGQPVPDAAYVRLDGGFQPGQIYEVIYRTGICPVAGAGLLAVRDTVSFLRYGSDQEGNPCRSRIDHPYGFGVSQSGRFLRDFLYLGLNIDEQGRQVFDGVIPHVAGARRGEFNQRYAQPSVQHVRSFGHLPPFTDGDPAGHDPAAGLLDKQRERGGLPRIFTTNSSSEYWRSDCSLIHTNLDGTSDIEPPDNTRIYLFAGTQHGPGSIPLNDTTPAGARGSHMFNVMDYTFLMRAALVNLDRWVSGGVEPPPSAFPRLTDRSAVTADTVLGHFSEIPGASLPDPSLLPRLRRILSGLDTEHGIVQTLPASGEAYPSFVPAVDRDGNEVAGIRLPSLTVPLGTHTGWNPRHPESGGQGQIMDMMGSTLPFASDSTTRNQTHDPRPAITERYRDRAHYLELVRSEARRLVEARYMLEEDIDPVMDLAGEHYDYFITLRNEPTA